MLAAAWAKIRPAGASRQGRRAWFYAPWLAAAAIQGTNAVAQMLEGEWAFGFTSAIFAAMLAMWPVSARYEFREAWSDGYVEGVFTLHHSIRGTVPPPVVRQATTGYLAPEPWDRTAPPPHTTTTGEMP